MAAFAPVMVTGKAQPVAEQVSVVADWFLTRPRRTFANADAMVNAVDMRLDYEDMDALDNAAGNSVLLEGLKSRFRRKIFAQFHGRYGTLTWNKAHLEMARRELHRLVSEAHDRPTQIESHVREILPWCFIPTTREVELSQVFAPPRGIVERVYDWFFPNRVQKNIRDLVQPPN